MDVYPVISKHGIQHASSIKDLHSLLEFLFQSHPNIDPPPEFHTFTEE